MENTRYGSIGCIGFISRGVSTDISTGFKNMTALGVIVVVWALFAVDEAGEKIKGSFLFFILSLCQFIFSFTFLCLFHICFFTVLHSVRLSCFCVTSPPYIAILHFSFFASFLLPSVKFRLFLFSLPSSSKRC